MVLLEACNFITSIGTEGNKCIKEVFRPGRSPLCLVHRGSFPGQIAIDLVQKSVKLIVTEVTNCALVLITCFVFFVAFLTICIVTKGNKGPPMQ